MNVFSFVGNLGSDCKVDTLPNGTTVCRINVAVKSGYGDREKTNWVICSLFGKRAEGGLPQYLTKGAQVAVTGELSLDEWVAQDGTTKSTLECNVNEITLVGSRQGNQQPQQQQPRQQAPQPQQMPQQGYQQPAQPAQQPQQNYPQNSVPQGYNMPAGDNFDDVLF